MLTRIDAPKASENNYRFYRDSDGELWKVLVEVRPLRRAGVSVARDTLAPIEYSIHVSASPATEDGRALRDADDRVLVGDPDSFSFTEHHMRGPDFDAEAQVMRMIVDRIAATAARLSGNAAIRAIGGLKS